MTTQLIDAPAGDVWHATPRLTGTSSRAVTVLDREGIIRYQTTPMLCLIGHEADTLIDKSLYAFLDVPSAGTVRDTLRSFTCEDQRFARWQIRIRSTSGSYNRLTGRATNFLRDPRLSGVLVHWSRQIG